MKFNVIGEIKERHNPYGCFRRALILYIKPIEIDSSSFIHMTYQEETLIDTTWKDEVYYERAFKTLWLFKHKILRSVPKKIYTDIVCDLLYIGDKIYVTKLYEEEEND